MIQVAIRQSGGASIVSLPKTILKTLHLDIGSSLELSVQDNRIILTPVSSSPTLESLLAGSPKANLLVREDDAAWLSEPAQGKEIL